MYYDKKYCNRYACDSIADIYCNSCKFTAYCSNYCRVNDLPGHSLICSHDMSTRIFNYIRVLQSRFNTCCISINSPDH